MRDLRDVMTRGSDNDDNDKMTGAASSAKRATTKDERVGAAQGVDCNDNDDDAGVRNLETRWTARCAVALLVLTGLVVNATRVHGWTSEAGVCKPRNLDGCVGGAPQELQPCRMRELEVDSSGIVGATQEVEDGEESPVIGTGGQAPSFTISSGVHAGLNPLCACPPWLQTDSLPSSEGSEDGFAESDDDDGYDIAEGDDSYYFAGHGACDAE